jgi:hypothetical protein
MTMERGFVYQ